MPNVGRVKSIQGGPIRLLIKGWAPDVEKELAAGGFDRVEFHGGEYDSFAALVPFKDKIASIAVFGGTWRSAGGLAALSELRAFTAGTRLPADLDFRLLPQLRELNFDAWLPGYAKSVFDCKNLRALRIEGYGGKDCSEIGRLTDLRRLSLAKGSLQSLQGLAGCSGLEAIELAHLRKFSDLAEIALLANLRELDLSDALPALHDLAPIFQKSALRRLSLRALDVEHADISWLKDFTKLNVLGIWNVVPVDWDALLASPHLKKLAVTFTKSTGLSLDKVTDLAKQQGLNATDVKAIGVPSKQKGYLIEFRPPGSTQNLWYWDDAKP